MKTLLVSLLSVAALAAAPLASARTHHAAAAPETHRHRWVTPLHKTAADKHEAPKHEPKAKAARHHHGKVTPAKSKTAKTKPHHRAAKSDHKAAKVHKAVKPHKAAGKPHTQPKTRKTKPAK